MDFKNKWKIKFLFSVAGVIASLSCSTPSFSDDFHKSVNVIFDINGVTMDGYDPTPGFGDVISVLLANPRYRVFFFSTQSQRSIREQVREVRLRDGRYADEVAQIFDGSFMGDLDQPKFEPRRQTRLDRPSYRMKDDPRSKYSVGYATGYKDLRAIVPLDELPNTILVDDTFRKAHPSQIANLLWLRDDLAKTPIEIQSPVSVPEPPKLPPRPNVNDSRKGLWGRLSKWASSPGPAVQPFSLQGYGNSGTFDRRYVNKRADFIIGVIDSAVRISDLQNISVSDALATIQWGHPGPIEDKPKYFAFSDPSVVDNMVAHGEKQKLAILGPLRDCARNLREAGRSLRGPPPLPTKF
jgi:hypothetical protein